LHEARRQPRAVAVAPGGTVQRPQHSLGAHAADVPQRVLEHALLGGDLAAIIDVLHRAAAASAEEGAAWCYARGGLPADSNDLRQLERRLLAVRGVLDFLAGDRAVDEDRLALDVRDAAPFAVERLDARDRHAGPAYFQCPRNSRQCGSPDFARVSRTSVSSFR